MFYKIGHTKFTDVAGEVSHHVADDRLMVQYLKDVPDTFQYRVLIRPEESIHLINLTSIEDLMEVSDYIGINLSVYHAGIDVDDWGDYVGYDCVILDKKDYISAKGETPVGFVPIYLGTGGEI